MTSIKDMTSTKGTGPRQTVMRLREVDLYVEDTGGPGEAILFLHGFFFDGRMYDAQVAALKDRYRCLTLDFRGQGRSGASARGYQLEQLTADVLAVIRRLELAPVHLVGLSMGGWVALRIAAREPHLVRSLTLLNSSATAHPRSKLPKYLFLAGVARLIGPEPAPVLAGIEGEMYGARFRSDPARANARETWRRRWADADRTSLARTMLGFMLRPDIRDELPGVVAPTLIVTGEYDAALSPSLSREMQFLIPDARLVVLPGVGHSSTLEDPDGVTEALDVFLSAVAPPSTTQER